MSKIRLHGSSSGYTEIAPVAASGNNTVTLPNDGTLISQDSNGAVGVTSITVGTGVTIGDGKITCDGSALTSINAAQLVGVCTSGLTKTGGFGKLVQVVSTTKTDTFSENLSGGNFTADAMSLSITPTASTNKILISADVTIGCEANVETKFQIFKAGSVLTGAIADADGSRTRVTSISIAAPGNGQFRTIHGQYLDTAGGTSAITYSIRLGHGGNGTEQTYLNRSHTDTNGTSDSRAASTITLMEISA